MNIALPLYLAFCLAASILVLIPGPNVALILANSLSLGTRYGLMTVAGTSSAIAVHLLLTVWGLSAALQLLAAAFDWLRWAGVAYLLYLGWRAWTSPPADLSKTGAQQKSMRAIFARGFLVGLTNPKTLLFYGAFFPQFITPGDDAAGQLRLLAITFFVLASVLDGVWALSAGAARALVMRHQRLAGRLTGGLLIGCAAGLALARRG